MSFRTAREQAQLDSYRAAMRREAHILAAQRRADRLWLAAGAVIALVTCALMGVAFAVAIGGAP